MNTSPQNNNTSWACIGCGDVKNFYPSISRDFARGDTSFPLRNEDPTDTRCENCPAGFYAKSAAVQDHELLDNHIVRSRIEFGNDYFAHMTGSLDPARPNVVVVAGLLSSFYDGLHAVEASDLNDALTKMSDYRRRAPTVSFQPRVMLPGRQIGTWGVFPQDPGISVLMRSELEAFEWRFHGLAIGHRDECEADARKRYYTDLAIARFPSATLKYFKLKQGLKRRFG